MIEKYLMITGSYPPDICGVGDYTSCFMNAADKSKWQLYYSKDWHLSSIIRKIQEINRYNAEAIVMQYPTQGYGWSLLPLLLCWYYSIFTNKTFIVVLHEFSQRTLKAKLVTSLFRFANRIIFTTNYEKSYAERCFKFSKKKSSVVKIISNIEAVEKSDLKQWDEREIDIAFFGHLAPNKGLEDFFNVVQSIFQKRNTVRIAIIGQIQDDYKNYYNSLLQRYEFTSQCAQFYNKPSAEVSSLLNNTKIVFLPFPDGISERRGSFLAAISNGAVVLSYVGNFTTEELKKIIVPVDSRDAAQTLCLLLELYDKERMLTYHSECISYLNNNIPSSWRTVVSLYEKNINSNTR